MDRYQDIDMILPKFKMFKEITKIDYRKLGVYVLCNFDTTIDQDLERIYALRTLGYSPYVMLYNKDGFVECDANGKPMRLKPISQLLKKYTPQQIEHFKTCWAIQGWVNNRIIFAKCETFTEYTRARGLMI